MKPRIFKLRGLWYCMKMDRSLLGVGYSPVAAYEDWLQRNGYVLRFA